MAYHFTLLFPFVSMILRSTGVPGHTARSKALTVLLQGLLVFKQASLSGMGRGGAVLYEEKSFRGQLKKAHRFMKNAQIATWETGAAFLAHMTQELPQVCIAVDWTALGAFRVLEACLIVEGRGMPFYSLFVHKDDLKHRQTLVELTMWYALIAMRQAGQTLLGTVDRGCAKFDWVGASPLYPFIHLLLRLKRTTLLTWGTIRGATARLAALSWRGGRDRRSGVGARRPGGDSGVSGASQRCPGAPVGGLSSRRLSSSRCRLSPAAGGGATQSGSQEQLFTEKTPSEEYSTHGTDVGHLRSRLLSQLLQ